VRTARAGTRVPSVELRIFSKGSRMNRFSLLFPLAFAGALLLSGCGAKSDGDTQPAASGTASTGSVAAVSKYDAGPRAGESEPDDEQAEAGKDLFSNKGCTACHAFGKKMSGPDLAGVSMRRTAQWMENQILHPERMVKEDPIARELFAKHALQMPNQGLTPEQARWVIEYLKHQDREAAEKQSSDK
jgi:cytochrome c551/c552